MPGKTQTNQQLEELHMMKSFARSLYRLRSNWPLFGPATTGRFTRFMTGCFMACVAVAACHSPAMAGTIDFKDWTASFNSGVEHWDNSSSAGTIAGTSACPGCWGAPNGTFGVANAINPPGPITFTTEFNAATAGSSANFVFSNNYTWGATGGELILGNIHNYLEYTLSAWTSGGVSIDVNTWLPLTEYLNGAAGQLGYFSTSSTGHCVSTSTSGNPTGQSVCPGATTASESFFVYDTGADANSGQGGVLVLGNLQNVGRIQLTLASNDLNNQIASPGGSDFILFNVGSSAPEPSTVVLVGAAGLLLLVRRRRSRGAA